MQFRLFKLRFKRRLKRSQRQVEDLGVQAEAGLEQHFFKRLGKLGQVWHFITLWLLLVVILIGCVVVQLEGLSNYYQTTRPVVGGTYTEGVLGTFTNANPLYATSEVDATVSHLIFASLFTYNDRNELVGDLASNWSVDDKGTTYTVHLRPNLTWQDGQPLTADDVVFTYQAIQNPDAQSPLNSSWAGISVAKVNAYTITFTLPNPLSSFPYTLTNGIVPKHVLGDKPVTELRSANFNTVQPVGAGPFSWGLLQVSNSDPTTAQIQIALKPFAAYHGGAPKLDSFVVHAFADESQLLSAFRSRSVNAMVGVDSLPADIAKDTSVQQYTFLRTAEEMVFFNTSSGVLSDAKVRHALVQGASVPAILKQLGYATKAVNEPLLTGQLGYNPAYAQAAYNQSQAMAALEQDGWTIGKNGILTKGNTPLSFTLSAPDTSEARLVTRVLQAQWRALGVDAKVQLQSPQDFQNTLGSAGPSPQYDALLYGVTVGVDPDVFVYWDSSQTDPRSNRLNFSDYKSTTADTALEAGRTRLDPSLRAIKYKPFLQAWQADAPALGLYQPRLLYVTHEKVYGLNEHFVNSDTDRFDNVQNWMVRTAKVTN
jgi:peptide/nickel transport system substrate-binding protein